MKNFDIKEFLTENKLTETSKKLEEAISFEDLSDDVKELFSSIGITGDRNMNIRPGSGGKRHAHVKGFSLNRHSLDKAAKLAKEGKLLLVRTTKKGAEFIFSK